MSTDAQQFLDTYNALPPAVQDEVADAILRHRGNAGVECEAADRKRLREQIQAGIDSPAVSAEEAIARLKQVASELAEGPS